MRLAPCYDVVATRVYKNDINEMSLSINGKLNIDEVTRADCNGNEIINGINIKYFENKTDFMKVLLEGMIKE